MDWLITVIKPLISLCEKETLTQPSICKIADHFQSRKQLYIHKCCLSVCLSVIKTPQTAKNQSFHRTTNAHYNLHHPHLHPHHNHRHHYPSIILILSILQQSLNFILPTITIIILPSSSFHHLQISTLFQQSFTFILTTITLIILPSSIHYPPTIQQSLTFLLTTITIIILPSSLHHPYTILQQCFKHLPCPQSYVKTYFLSFKIYHFELDSSVILLVP